MEDLSPGPKVYVPPRLEPTGNARMPTPAPVTDFMRGPRDASLDGADSHGVTTDPLMPAATRNHQPLTG
jgi:hypothetical protein